MARMRERSVALLVDSVLGVIDAAPADVVAADAVLSDTGLFAGVLHLPDGLVLIHDLSRFLAIEEERQLAQALAKVEAIAAALYVGETYFFREPATLHAIEHQVLPEPLQLDKSGPLTWTSTRNAMLHHGPYRGFVQLGNPRRRCEPACKA